MIDLIEGSDASVLAAFLAAGSAVLVGWFTHRTKNRPTLHQAEAAFRDDLVEALAVERKTIADLRLRLNALEAENLELRATIRQRQ